MIKLSPRLQDILSEIEGESCADIGCDHGKLIVRALKENRIGTGYGIDISKASLEKAKSLSREENVSSRLTLLCGDGATVLDKKVDVAVIAGMGANETIHILTQGDFAKKYILSPHQDAQVLRRYLAENSYYILKDYIIFDKKYYPVIVAERGESNYKSDEMYFGKNIPPRPEFGKYVTLRKNKLDELISLLGDKINEETKKESKEADICYKKISLP